MSHSLHFIREIRKHGVSAYYGVPDSTLGSLCDLMQKEPGHVVAVNEGAAVAIGAGYYLATGNTPLIYMQNSGFGNALNPLLSLCDADVYSIPMLLLVGWRGVPGGTDEPQHYKQGLVTEDLLKAIGTPYCVLEPDAAKLSGSINWAIKETNEKSCPVVMLAMPGVFKKNASLVIESDEIGRRDAIRTIINSVDGNSIIVASTGYIARETHDLIKDNPDAPPSFLVVGSMGHASQIALGLALEKKEKTIICLDGDGAALMHMGGLATIGAAHLDNFIHVVLNNGIHASVGGMPTVAKEIDLSLLARGCGYKNIFTVDNERDLLHAMQSGKGSAGTSFLDVRMAPDVAINVGRPKDSPINYRDIFMRKIGSLM